MQGTSVAASRYLAVSGASLFACLGLEHRDERIERRVALCDAQKALVEHRFGRGLSRL